MLSNNERERSHSLVAKELFYRTTHIAIRYFFVKDRIDKNEVKLVYMKTEDILADFFTIPL
jgi:hypothetical protein